MTPSRRSFLKSSAATVAAASLGPPRTLFAAPPAKPLAWFNYGDVELLEGPLRQQYDANHAAYSALNEDSLLQPFRQRAGLPAPGEEMGGWYSWAPIADIDKRPNNGFAPGHSFGQYLSGLSRDYAATGKKATQAKVHRLVRAFAPAITPHFWDDHRFPAYTYDKLAIGLIDAQKFTGAPDAFKILDKTLDSVQARLPPGGISRDQQYARPHTNDSFCWDEPYTLAENAFIAYKRGAGQRYHDLAVKFLPNDWYFDPLAAGQNVLPGKHAYSHVNCLSSAMQAYFTLGPSPDADKYLRAAVTGFDFIRAQSFATGGWGPDESFRKPDSGELGESLAKTHSSFETPCGSYAHFKLTRYLIRATRDTLYGDSMERVLYNCILGAKPLTNDGHGFYYSDYNNDGSKVYHPYKWHCCTGTFSQITADYGLSSYFHDRDGIYVNLYVPSRVKWSRLGDRVVLTQRTAYPHHPSTQIEVTTDKTSAFRVALRIPAWSGPNTTIAVNGVRIAASPEPGTFAHLDRAWKTGDHIEVEFDMPTTLEHVDPQHPNLVAPVHGPLALFATGEVPKNLRRQDLQAMTQIAAGSTDWQAKTDTGSVTLRPFTAINDEHYRLYHDLQS
jgi:DUF1680 family protein